MAVSATVWVCVAARRERAPQAGGDPGLGRHLPQLVVVSKGSPAEATTSSLASTGRSKATLRNAKASWTVDTMSSRISDSGRSSMSRSVSSKSRRMASSC